MDVNARRVSDDWVNTLRNSCSKPRHAAHRIEAPSSLHSIAEPIAKLMAWLEPVVRSHEDRLMSLQASQLALREEMEALKTNLDRAGLSLCHVSKLRVAEGGKVPLQPRSWQGSDSSRSWVPSSKEYLCRPRKSKSPSTQSKASVRGLSTKAGTSRASSPEAPSARNILPEAHTTSVCSRTTDSARSLEGNYEGHRPDVAPTSGPVLALALQSSPSGSSSCQQSFETVSSPMLQECAGFVSSPLHTDSDIAAMSVGVDLDGHDLPTAWQAFNSRVELPDTKTSLDLCINLATAVRNGEATLCKTLLAANAEPTAADARGVTPLHTAVFNGHEELCQLLLDGRADANACDQHGQPPLFFAPTAKICQLLCESSADLTSRNHSGLSAFQLANHAGLDEVVEWLSAAASAVRDQEQTPGKLTTDLADKSLPAPKQMAAQRQRSASPSAGLELTASKAQWPARRAASRGSSLEASSCLQRKAAMLIKSSVCGSELHDQEVDASEKHQAAAPPGQHIRATPSSPRSAGDRSFRRASW
mmetsp:Transcript_35664/g.65388  ORF Transcript_35664/g.65388 Transcript_35664/m.65388 type:complete len:532 (-) Transcript_35664:53-1648(-)